MDARETIHVAVCMGGRTAEHEISLETGRLIVAHLDRKRFRVKPVVIGTDGAWTVWPGYLDPAEAWQPRKDPLPPAARLGAALDGLQDDGVDVVFLAMHGPFGEDGTIQGLFDMLDMPYTGSDVSASALCMDKIRCKEILAYHGIPTPAFVTLDAESWTSESERCCERIVERVGLPAVVKTPRLGSSVGIDMASDETSLRKAVDKALRYDRRVLVEACVEGTEITCPVLGAAPGEALTPLPLIEIVPKTSSWFDYHAKYTAGATEEICPARVEEEQTKRAQALALRIHELLGCGGLSRIDMMITDRGLTVFEVNTIPGMTDASLYPQAARAVGIDFPRLLGKLIDLALSQHRSRLSCVQRD